MNFEKLDEILAVDEVVRYVSIVDLKGNTIASKIKKNAMNVSKDEERKYTMDLCITKQMLDIFNGPFGRTISMQIIREKTYQLIYYHDSLIIYVTCDPSVDRKKIPEVSGKIEQLVREL